ncbi:MAG: rhomboid family intramembrane serine protease [Chloroflexota bacterium]
MLPLNDIEPNRYTSWPFMTLALVCLNVIIMGFENIVIVQDRETFQMLITLLGIVPTDTLQQATSGAITSVTYMFLHGGVWHLLGNMLALWVYGRRVEDLCGPWRFLLFYILCGIFASFITLLTQSQSDIPVIGASGAIFGVMGAYLLLFPRGRIRTLVLLGIVPLFPKIRAYWIILYFLAINIPPAFNMLVYQDLNYQTAHWTHLGGFLAGLFVFCFIRTEAFYRYRNDLPL